ncbi:MAG: ribosome silencing factor [Spirochaetes bacterium]|nr:ribosome silencing factor [Spirochaetota bacterium]
MEDLLSETEPGTAGTAGTTDTKGTTGAAAAGWVYKLGEVLKAHNGQDVAVIDVRAQIDWTDFFIIAGATSFAHLDGLERYAKEFCDENGIEILRKSGKNVKVEDGWRIIDLGQAVVHLMNKSARDFYDLERLVSVGWRSKDSLQIL